MEKKSLRVLLLLSLFSSLGFTAPVYVDFQDPEPDEWLDFFGIPNSITTLEVIPKTLPAVFGGLIPDSHIFQSHYSRDLSLQPFISVPVLSGPLLC
jgi:hypothetical protein